MSKIPTSQNSLQNIYNDMGNVFIPNTTDLLFCVPKLEEFKNYDLSSISDDIERGKQELHTILAQLNVFNSIVTLDILSTWRANHRSESNVEKRFNIKYLSVRTIEGYRYLFGKDKRDTKFALLTKLKIIAEQIGDDDLIEDISILCSSSGDFTTNFYNSKDILSRNFSTHFDYDPIKFYDYLSSIIDDDIEVKRIGAFQAILIELSRVICKYSIKYKIDLFKTLNEYDIEMKEVLNLFPDNDNSFFNQLSDMVMTFEKSLSAVYQTYKKPEKISEIEGVPELDLNSICQVADNIFPAMHLHFIYLELACSVRAYLSSEYYLERQLNLRRINVIIYEGFKKIYGYTEQNQSISFWKSFISEKLKLSTDSDIASKITEIESQLQAIASDENINRENIRESSVHYRYKDRDNTVSLFEFTVNASPFIEFGIAHKLFDITPKIIQQNINSMTEVHRQYKERQDIPLNKLVAKIDNYIKKIEDSNATQEQKQVFVDCLSKAKEITENPLEYLRKNNITT